MTALAANAPLCAAPITDSKTWTANDDNVGQIELINKDHLVELNAKGFDLSIPKNNNSTNAFKANNSTFTLSANNFTAHSWQENRANSHFELHNGSQGTVVLTGDFDIEHGQLALYDSSLELSANNASMSSLWLESGEANLTLTGKLTASQIHNSGNSSLVINADSVDINGSVQSSMDSSETNNLTITTRGDITTQKIWQRSEGTVSLSSSEGNITIQHKSGWEDALAFENASNGIIQALAGTVTIGAKEGDQFIGVSTTDKSSLKIDAKNLMVYGSVQAESASKMNIAITEDAEIFEHGNFFSRNAFGAETGASIAFSARNLVAHGNIRSKGTGTVVDILAADHYRFVGESTETLLVASEGGTLRLSVGQSGTIESKIPGSANASIQVKGGTLELGGGAHILDGWASFDQQAHFALIDPSKKGMTTFKVENYAEENNAAATSRNDRFSALSVSASNIDFSGLNGEFRTRAKVDGQNVYKGFADSSTPNPVLAAAVRVSNGGSLTLADANYTIAGAIIAGRGTQNENDKAGTISMGKGGTLQIYGDVFAGNGGQIELTLGAGSIWEGMGDDWHELKDGITIGSVNHDGLFVDDKNNPLEVTSHGTLNVNMAGGTWIARGQSFISTLNFGDALPSADGTAGSTIDLSKETGSSIKIDTLKGTSGTFRMRLHSDYAQSDMLFINRIETTRNAQFTIDAVIPEGVHAEDLEGLRFATTGSSMPAGLFVVKSENEGFNNIQFSVKNEDYDPDHKDNVEYNAGNSSNAQTGKDSFKPGDALIDETFGKDGKNWLLGKANASISEGGEVVLATARGTYWQSVEMDRLNKRLGDRRMVKQGDDGFWIRVRNDRIGTSAGVGDFRSRNYTYQLGYDHTKAESDGKRLFGIAFDYMDGNVDYRSISGNGSTDRFGITAYMTWLADNGWYVDALTKWGVLSNSFDISNSSGSRVTGNYDNHVLGASFEFGRKLTQENSPWFIEPQAQIQHVMVTQADYSTNQGSRVAQDQINSTITRLGFRVGRTFDEQKSSMIYAKTDWMKEWHGHQRIIVTDKTTAATGSDASIDNKGNWFDVGLGFQSLVTDSIYAFADAEYMFGNDLKKSWNFNAGMRWMF